LIFTSQKYNARHAYFLVPLAVKTSRPHFEIVFQQTLFLKFNAKDTKFHNI
jgi:hypothetical protein